MPSPRFEMLAAPVAEVRVDSVVAALNERRREDSHRTVTLYRTGLLTTARGRGLCRIRNMSDAGLLIVTSMILVPQQKVQISLSETISLCGQIAWIGGANAGINLAHRIDTASLLHRLAAEHRLGVYRARRLTVNATGTLSTEQGIQPVRINNISQQGMQVAQDGNLIPGQLVKVALRNGLERYGIVRWTGNGVAGLRLTEPIPVEQLNLDSEVSHANEQQPSANTAHPRPTAPH